MSTPPFARRFASPWLFNLTQGSVNAVAWMAVMLTLGLLAFSPLRGYGGAALGVSAAFATVVAGGAVYAAFGSTPCPVSSASSATALILAALMTRLLADPALDLSGPGGVAAVLACTAASVVLMGLLQIAGGLLGVGTVALYVPQPVLAGFMNGVALLILVAQLPPLLGLPPLAHLGLAEALASAQPLALLLGLATAAVVWVVNRRHPHAPAALVGLLAGCGAYLLLTPVVGTAAFGSALGELPQGLVRPDALGPLTAETTRALLSRHASEVVQTAAVMAVIGSLESLLAAIGIDRLTHTRHDSRRELLALGAGNIASGLCGGLPLVLSRARSMLLLEAGARGRWPIFVSVVAFALLLALGSPVLQLLPRAVLAGIMLTIALALVDHWTRQLLRQWWHGLKDGNTPVALRNSLLLVATVCLVTVWFGFVAAVLTGLLLSMLLFIFRMNRGLVRSRRTAASRGSRRIYGATQEALLQTCRERIAVLELEGALFFGSAERLARETDALPPDCRCLVLDFKRIGSIDESGAVTLQSLQRRLALRGVPLLLAAVSEANVLGNSLRAYGCFLESPRNDWLPDLDRALEAAEALLLADAGLPPPTAALALSEAPLLQGLSPAQSAAVQARMPVQSLRAGEPVFRQGDPGDRLYVLIAGSISIVRTDTVPTQRYVSFSAGMVFGETAMLDGGGRTADAVADTEALVHALSLADFDTLSTADPALGAQLSRNIALHLSVRLRSAGAAWQAAG